jgi:hypothetical protein
VVGELVRVRRIAVLSGSHRSVGGLGVELSYEL